jgi:hypothetical protein
LLLNHLALHCSSLHHFAVDKSLRSIRLLFGASCYTSLQLESLRRILLHYAVSGFSSQHPVAFRASYITAQHLV